MTIDEAIAHALEVAGEQQERADSAELIDILDGLDVESCKECAADHRQLAEWLQELKEAKRLLKAAVEDFAVYGALKDLPSEQRVQSPYWRRFNRVFDILDHQWRYADDAMRLIGDDVGER